MAFNLLKNLKDYPDLDLSVILLNEGRLTGKLRECGLNVQVIDENRYSFREIVRRTCSILRADPPDLIHSHRYKENLLAFLVSRCYRRTRLVSTQHGLPELYAEKADIFRRLKIRSNFFFLSRYFRTVAVSEEIRNVLISRCGFRKESVEVIHNGIDIPCPGQVRGETGKFVIGSSGRLFPVKDFPLMVDIARTVAATRAADIVFELAGNGPEMPALDALVKGSGLSSGFYLRGHLDDMGAFYRELDIYLNTSVHEGIPMTILEALAHGLPVIAPAVGGIVEIIEDGVDGFLVEGRNPHDFAEKCLILRDNRELRERMSKAAREKAEKCFSAARMAEKYYSLYGRIGQRSDTG